MQLTTFFVAATAAVSVVIAGPVDTAQVTPAPSTSTTVVNAIPELVADDCAKCNEYNAKCNNHWYCWPNFCEASCQLETCREVGDYCRRECHFNLCTAP